MKDFISSDILSTIQSSLGFPAYLNFAKTEKRVHKSSNQSMLWQKNLQKYFPHAASLFKDLYQQDPKALFIREYQYTLSQGERILKAWKETFFENLPTQWRQFLLAALEGNIEKIAQCNLTDKEKDLLYVFSSINGHKHTYPYLHSFELLSLAFACAAANNNQTVASSLLSYLPELYKRQHRETTSLEIAMHRNALDEVLLRGHVGVIESVFVLSGDNLSYNEKEMWVCQAVGSTLSVFEKAYELCEGDNFSETSIDKIVKYALNLHQPSIIKKILSTHKYVGNLEYDVMAAISWGDIKRLEILFDIFKTDLTVFQKSDFLIFSVKCGSPEIALKILALCKEDILKSKHYTRHAINAIDYAARKALKHNKLQVAVAILEKHESSLAPRTKQWIVNEIFSQKAHDLAASLLSHPHAFLMPFEERILLRTIEIKEKSPAAITPQYQTLKADKEEIEGPTATSDDDSEAEVTHRDSSADSYVSASSDDENNANDNESSERENEITTPKKLKK